jgi:serine protease AprX
MKKSVFYWLRMSCILLTGTSSFGMAQSLYFVTFIDKETAAFHPENYFTEEAMSRRHKNGISGFDFWDMPVNESYVKEVASIADSLRYRLRWFNAVTVKATEAQVAEMQKLFFVASVIPFDPLMVTPAAEAEMKADPAKLAELYSNQRALMNMDTLLAHGLTGKGVRIAVFDAGFKEVDTHPAFAKMRAEGRIVQARDFFSNKRDPYFHSSHGTQVLGCIGGFMGDKPIGAATDASFYLARTEHFLQEKIIEEDHWLAAMEWADSLGVDIISSSLGYTDSRYTFADLNGQKTKVTQAAAMAVRKGILVVNSLGNEGAGAFHYLGAPADADSVLSVGGSFPQVKFPIVFSSYGPNARGVMKPEISAPGYVVSAGSKGSYGISAGTSFSCPLISGFAACVMQKQPQWSCMQVRAAIMNTGHFGDYYDYRLGNGVADASLLFHSADSVSATLTVKKVADTLFVVLDTMAGVSANLNAGQPEPLFYHIEKPSGGLLEFQSVMVPAKTVMLKLPAQYLSNPGRLRIFYRGFVWEE